MEGDSSHTQPRAPQVSPNDQSFDVCTFNQNVLARGPVTSKRVQMQPPKELSIIHFNARSLLPKFDELCVLVESNQPDIICITETWLCTDVLDNEISIPGYNTYRQDRNRHGGGTLMYIKCELVVIDIPNLSPSLEFLPVSISFLNFKFCVCAFYRLPSSYSSIFETFLSLWKNSTFLSFVTFYVLVILMLILMIHHIIFILSFVVFYNHLVYLRLSQVIHMFPLLITSLVKS